MKNHLIMFANASVLIVLGIVGYFMSGSPTAFIGTGVGIILGALAIPTMKENAVAAHIAVALTLIAGIAFAVVGFKRSNTLVIIMAAACLVSVVFYAVNFIKRKKSV